MTVLLVVLCLIEILYTSAQLSNQCNTEGDVRLVLRSTDRDVPSEGVPEICLNNEWRRICNSGRWTETEATVVCRQLGFSDQGATARTGCPSSTTLSFAQLTECSGKENTVQECGIRTTSSCCSSNQEGFLFCQLANCENGALRLVGGSTNNEGRVEVCMSGRWGTICSNEGASVLAGAACSLLGFSAQGAQAVSTFTTTGPLTYSCTVSDDDLLLCHLSETCSHNFDLGVVCGSTARNTPTPLATLPPTITKVDPLTTISPDVRSLPLLPDQTCPTVTCPSCDLNSPCPTQTQALSCDTCILSCINNNSQTRNENEGTQPIRSTDSSHTVPYIIIGVLCFLLIATTIGWICTIIVFKKRCSTKSSTSNRTPNIKQEVLNPIYTRTTPLEQSTSSNIKDEVQIRTSRPLRVNTYDAIINMRGQENSTSGEYSAITGGVSRTYNALMHNGYPLQKQQPVLDGKDYSKLRQSQISQSVSFSL